MGSNFQEAARWSTRNVPPRKPTHLCTDENFDKAALLFSAGHHGGVVKEQRRRRDSNFLTKRLGELAHPPVSIIIRPVRRQNCMPTHWVRK
jgi:hypothetical protein